MGAQVGGARRAAAIDPDGHPISGAEHAVCEPIATGADQALLAPSQRAAAAVDVAKAAARPRIPGELWG